MSGLEPYNEDAERSVVGAIICAASLDLDACHRVRFGLQSIGGGV